MTNHSPCQSNGHPNQAPPRICLLQAFPTTLVPVNQDRLGGPPAEARTPPDASVTFAALAEILQEALEILESDEDVLMDVRMEEFNFEGALPATQQSPQ